MKLFKETQSLDKEAIIDMLWDLIDKVRGPCDRDESLVKAWREALDLVEEKA